jgi:6-pyruvoyltetrahydropterin/6-carboxytetrahydropterin synthase
MFAVSVEREFVAAHHVRMPDGSLESPHDHRWKVRALFRAPTLDSVGMVVDFVAATQALAEVVGALDGTDLNRNPALSGRNPTAEVVAQFVLASLRAAGWPSLYAVEVTEAPGCLASCTIEFPSVSVETPAN